MRTAVLRSDVTSSLTQTYANRLTNIDYRLSRLLPTIQTRECSRDRWMHVLRGIGVCHHRTLAQYVKIRREGRSVEERERERMSSSALPTALVLGTLAWSRVSRVQKLATMAYVTTASLLLLLVCYSEVGMHCSASSLNNIVQGELRAQQTVADRHTNKVGVVLDSSPHPTGDAIGINWNRVIDFILDMAKKEIGRLDKAEVDLPEIAEEFTNKVLLVKLHGEFKADQGRLSDLSTVQRTGDVKVTRQGSRFTITCSLGLGMVQLRYGHYRAKIRNVASVSGHIKGGVGRNSIRVTATVDVKDGQCAAVLNEVKVVQLDGLKITVSGSGFGPLNWLITKMTNSYAQKNRADITAKIEQGLAGEISKAIKEFHCEQYFALLVL